MLNAEVVMFTATLSVPRHFRGLCLRGLLSLAAALTMLATTASAQNTGTLSAGKATGAEALHEKYECVECHQPTTRGLGPSYRDIAQKYQYSAQTETQLLNSVRNGSNGKWLGAAMPPMTRGSDAEIRAILQWALNK